MACVVDLLGLGICCKFTHCCEACGLWHCGYGGFLDYHNIPLSCRNTYISYAPIGLYNSYIPSGPGLCNNTNYNIHIYVMRKVCIWTTRILLHKARISAMCNTRRFRCTKLELALCTILFLAQSADSRRCGPMRLTINQPHASIASSYAVLAVALTELYTPKGSQYP